MEVYTCQSGGYPFGISWRRNQENIDVGELAQADNCEYDHADNALKTVDGVKVVYDAGVSIDRMFYNHVYGIRYFSSGQNLYRTDLTTKTLIGTLAGTSKPVFCMFGDNCLVASGGLLQRIVSGTTLQTLSGSPPVSHYVTSRMGRVVAFSTSSDVLNYSAIGDESNWTNNPNDSSSGQYADVGYKDPGNIIGISFLASMLIVKKKYGRAYGITGEPPNSSYSIFPTSQTADCASIDATLSVDNKDFFLGSGGFVNFVPTTAFGDITPQEAGININAQLARNTDSNANLWHIQPRKQIWIKSQNEKRIYIYHYIPRYDDGRGAFTTRSFSYALNDVSIVKGEIFIAYGNKIGKLDSTIDTDDGNQIITNIMSRNQLPAKRHLLLRSKTFFCKNLVSGYGSLSLGKKPAVPLTFGASSPKIFGNTAKIYGNTNKIFASTTTRYYKIGGGGGNDNLQVKIQVQKGAIALRQMDYNYSEV